jgi:hypothetical protein
VALSEDQKAILRLLAQRGAAGYEDLAALLGTSVEDVHARAKGAAEQLESEGIPAPAVPEPGGGGGRAPEPAAPEPPKAVEPPDLPPHPPEPPNAAPEPPPALPKGPPKPSLRKELKLLENRGLWAILAGVAIVVLFVVFVIDPGGGGDSSSTSTSAETAAETSPETSGTAANGKELTQAVLNPVDGSEASGKAIFGRVKNRLALQVFAEGLQQTGSGESYTIWLAASPQKMLPLASAQVKADGQIRAQIEVPTEILAYLANETFGQLAITRTDESQLKASLAKATKEKKAPLYTGTEVLRGTVTGPIVGLAKEEEGE